MQQKYKKVKTLNNTSGQGKNSFPFYEEIDNVLAHINPLSTLSSGAGGTASSSDNTLDALETEPVFCQVSTAWMRRVFCARLLLQKTSLSILARKTMHLPYLLVKRSQNQSKGRRTRQARKENSQSQHLLTKWKVPWRFFLKFSKSPRDDSWSLKNKEVNKKPSKKRKDNGSKQNRTDEKRENVLLRVLQTIAQGAGGSKN